ncbi:hypothetical protein CYMTET_25152 [Cymbomonas tetramitiformis]|uniref:Uncharacterized protein n=1 Tax=Cymbomonas tetramitiformis TaxID=36881 RepID=A0AAE0KZ71_9CHLO|nr:hypothetical protein CYMTET_25152 [Cymbomonas tetramitiformis]
MLSPRRPGRALTSSEGTGVQLPVPGQAARSANMAGFHPEGTPVADMLAELDAAFLDPVEDVYETCLYSYSLEIGEAPPDIPAAQAAAVLVPHSAVADGEPWTQSEWDIWDSCGRSEEKYFDAVTNYNPYQDLADGECPDGVPVARAVGPTGPATFCT